MSPCHNQQVISGVQFDSRDDAQDEATLMLSSKRLYTYSLGYARIAYHYLSQAPNQTAAVIKARPGTIRMA